MSFVATVIANDGTSALMMCNGDPITNNVTPPTGITNCTIIATHYDNVNWTHGVYNWDGSAWQKVFQN